MSEEINITVENGEIVVDWWTPEAGDLICDLCGECVGWREVGFLKTGVANTCPHANPYCG